ncbi:hypothetical protein DL764_004300 [Monosporascus ibericus]|uniref:Uncharacterized protein n=1 Tax=Monosporascus ibericus TaxID=155417 RepID=A0A4Q4TFX8_9PEZI|nr:hypothetical protein DL764_004300 [Monosporascus ibericus]
MGGRPPGCDGAIRGGTQYHALCRRYARSRQSRGTRPGTPPTPVAAPPERDGRRHGVHTHRTARDPAGPAVDGAQEVGFLLRLRRRYPALPPRRGSEFVQCGEGPGARSSAAAFATPSTCTRPISRWCWWDPGEGDDDVITGTRVRGRGTIDNTPRADSPGRLPAAAVTAGPPSTSSVGRPSALPGGEEEAKAEARVGSRLGRLRL